MMLKKSISLLLCAVLAFSLCTFALPETALAYMQEFVFVGGTNVTNGGYWRNDGEGGIVAATSTDYNVHYASDTGILTLRDANISKHYSVNTRAYTAVPFAAIFAAVDSGLTITLEGVNIASGQNPISSIHTAGIYVSNGSLTINGSGSLTATGGNEASEYSLSCGIYADGNIDINSGDVTAIGGNKCGTSYGMCTIKGGVNISGGNVTATGGNECGTSYGMYTTNGDVTISGGNVTATGGAADASIGLNAAKKIIITGGTVNAAGAATAPASSGISALESMSISGGTVNAKGNEHALNKAPNVSAYTPTPAAITVSTYITGASAAAEYIPASITSYKYFRIAPQYPVSIGSNLMTATAMETSYYTNGANNGSSYEVGTVVTKGKTESAPDGWNAKLELENGEYVLTLKGLMLTADRGIKSDVNLKLLIDTTAPGSNIVSNWTVPAVDVNGDLILLAAPPAESAARTLITECIGNSDCVVKVTGNLTLDGESILFADTSVGSCSAINIGQNLTVGEKCQLSGQTHATQGAQTCGVKAGGNLVMNGSSLTCKSNIDIALEAGGGITLNSGDIDLNGSDKALNKEPDLGRHPQYVWQAETNPFALAPYIYSDTHKRLVIAAVPSATIGDVTVGGTVGSAIATTTAIAITIESDSFNRSWSEGDVISGWFTNIPSGISAKFNATPSGSKAWVVFSGTPTTSSTAPMTVTIPADVLNKGLPITVTLNENAKWNISTKSSGGSSGGSSSVTVYNDPVKPKATVWLTGPGLDNGDLLITERNPQGSAYNALLRLANSGDVFSTYNISLRSGKKSTGSAMNLTFDLGSDYAGQAFTLVHQKADGGYEYFRATADYFGDLSFGPLYELSPFMLVHGKLAQTAYANFTDMPKTGDSAQVTLVTCAALLMASVLLVAFAPRKRRD